MTTRVLQLDEIKHTPIEELLQTVVTAHQVLDILLPNGEEVIIQPKPQLPELPVLDGYVPENWKDAVYECAQ
ncbi:MAG: hypothetical protein GY801_36850 [bacterium]|nr:hypothetical protein [bacterium]